MILFTLPGWLPTFSRLRTFQFTGGLVQNKPSGFLVKPGNPDNFDFANLSDKKIGFIDGFFSDPGCVARNDDIYTTVSRHIISVERCYQLYAFFLGRKVRCAE